VIELGRRLVALASAPSIMLAPVVRPLLVSSRALALLPARSRELCTQALSVAVSGSYAYVAAWNSDSLVVVDISNPASPVLRGSVVSSSFLDGVRVALSLVHHACPRIMLATMGHRSTMEPLETHTQPHDLLFAPHARPRRQCLRLRGGSLRPYTQPASVRRAAAAH